MTQRKPSEAQTASGFLSSLRGTSLGKSIGLQALIWTSALAFSVGCDDRSSSSMSLPSPDGDGPPASDFVKMQDDEVLLELFRRHPEMAKRLEANIREMQASHGDDSIPRIIVVDGEEALRRMDAEAAEPAFPTIPTAQLVKALKMRGSSGLSANEVDGLLAMPPSQLARMMGGNVDISDQLTKIQMRQYELQSQ